MKKQKTEQPIYIDQFTVRPTYSVAYSVRADGLPPSRGGNSRPIVRSQGIVSSKAAAKISNAINWLLLFSHKKRVYSKKEDKSFSFVLNFITLTLSDKQKEGHTDKYILRHLLQPFLKWLGRNHAQLYVWRAETQMNGNLHFHITTNTFIHWKQIRKKWNNLQQRHGYLKKWTEGNNPDPNSTDVHAVKNERETARYMAKYMTKQKPLNYCSRYCAIEDKPNNEYELTKSTLEKNGSRFEYSRAVRTRLWGCSASLSNLAIRFNQHDTEFQECATFVERHSEVKTLDHATLFIHPNIKYLNTNSLIKAELIKLYNEVKPKISQQKFFTVESFH
jgi:hypothetical protein